MRMNWMALVSSFKCLTFCKLKSYFFHRCSRFQIICYGWCFSTGSFIHLWTSQLNCCASETDSSTMTGGTCPCVFLRNLWGLYSPEVLQRTCKLMWWFRMSFSELNCVSGYCYESKVFRRFKIFVPQHFCVIFNLFD